MTEETPGDENLFDEIGGFLKFNHDLSGRLDKLANLRGKVNPRAMGRASYLRRGRNDRGFLIDGGGDYRCGQDIGQVSVDRRKRDDWFRSKGRTPEDSIRMVVEGTKETRSLVESLEMGRYEIVIPTYEEYPFGKEEGGKILAELMGVPYVRVRKYLGGSYILLPDGTKRYLGPVLDNKGITSGRYRDNVVTPEFLKANVVPTVIEANLMVWGKQFMTVKGYSDWLLSNGYGDKAVEGYHQLRIVAHRTTTSRLEKAANDPQNAARIAGALQRLGYGKT